MKKKQLKNLIKSLESRVDDLEEWWLETENEFHNANAEAADVQLVKEVTPPAPISTALSFEELATELLGPYASYIEENDVYGIIPRYIQMGDSPIAPRQNATQMGLYL